MTGFVPSVPRSGDRTEQLDALFKTVRSKSLTYGWESVSVPTVGNEDMRRISPMYCDGLRILATLQRRMGGKPFSISGATLGRLLGIDDRGAYALLRLFLKHGVITQVTEAIKGQCCRQFVMPAIQRELANA